MAVVRTSPMVEGARGAALRGVCFVSVDCSARRAMVAGPGGLHSCWGGAGALVGWLRAPRSCGGAPMGVEARGSVSGNLFLAGANEIAVDLGRKFARGRFQVHLLC